MDEIKKKQIYALIQNDIKVFYKNRFLPLFKRYIDTLGVSEPIPRELLSADFGLYEIACPEEMDAYEKGIEELTKISNEHMKQTILKYEPEISDSNVKGE